MASRVPTVNLPSFMRDPDFVAPCSTADPDLWYPETGGSNKRAVSICGGCPKQLECANWSMEQKELWGVWGGLSERQRRRLRSPDRPVARCGTVAGYRRHNRLREVPCPSCLSAEAGRKSRGRRPAA